MVYRFRFIAGPGVPAEAAIRFDVDPPYVDRVSRLLIGNVEETGTYVRLTLAAYPIGTTIHVQATDRRYATFRITGAPILDFGGYIAIPVACLDSTLDQVHAADVDLWFFRETARERERAATAAVPAARDAATDPDLVDLATAKVHLRITDADHDADIQQKLTAASSTIRDYLKAKNDPTWTPSTVPPWIAQAVLLLLAHNYENRGDDFKDRDDRVWKAISNLLARSRDPALA